ncbi:MAG: competence/damage-inducible protein A [Clostridia bacterium]|nr:competence/damage-inducible protein A [Clostridia bacterium]
MQAEIITVGTEILLGQILNTNVKYLSEQLASLGINLYFNTTVGDNKERLKQALAIAAKRADLVILTGGLGPTEDDITKESLAEFLQLPLEVVPEELNKIKSLFNKTGYEWTENNLKQVAFIPNSYILTNEFGSAPGMALKYEDTAFIVLPGPPKEMTHMFLNYAVPWIKNTFKSESRAMLYSKVLKFTGIGEPSLEVLLADLFETQDEITLALYAKTGEIQLRITTRAENREEFERKITPVLTEIKKRTTPYLFGEDEVTITGAVAQLLLEKNLKISTAESCTGGMLAQYFTSIPGSSEFYLGSVVSYANSVKTQMLGVSPELLEKHGAVSREVGSAMAERIRVLTGSDLGIGITGIAGPTGGTSEKPVGLVYIALATPHQTICTEYQFNGDREIIRLRSVHRALYLTWKYLKNFLDME